jgi:hypothetical protein
LLALRGYFATRQQSGLFKTVDGRYVTTNKKGTPDYAVLHAVYPGFLMEVKRPGERASDAQILRIQEIQLGYRLAVVIVDDVALLNRWLFEHEGRSKVLWKNEQG